MDLAAAGMEAHPSLESPRPELTVGSLGGFPVGSYVGVPAGQQRAQLAYGQCDSPFWFEDAVPILHRGAAERDRDAPGLCRTSASSLTVLVNFLLPPDRVNKTVWIHQRFH